MTFDPERLLDRTGRRIVRALQENARVSFAELGRRVGLTPPAAAERVQKLEDAGVITGYHAAVDARRVGLPILAFIRVTAPAERYARLLELVGDLPEVLECHHVTGGESFVLKVAAASVAHLENVIGLLSPFGQTSTSVVLSSPIRRRALSVESGTP